MRPIVPQVLLILVAALAAYPVSAQLSVRDDLNRPLVVKHAATRVVTLAPFLTEMLYAVGAGDLAVGVDEHSDYPPEIAKVAKVPTGASFSLDKIAALKPDLVLAWRDGIRRDDIEKVSGFGALVYVASARQLDDVPRLLAVLGQLTGRDATAAISEFETKIDRIRRDNANKVTLTTFVEIWNRPLTTVSGEHFLTDALELCRGENIFAGLRGVAPKVTPEQLLERDPFVIVGAGSASSEDEFRANWQIRAALTAVRTNRLVYVEDESISRPTPRTPEGIARLCSAFDEVRAGRSASIRAVPTTVAATPQTAGMSKSLGGYVPSMANPVQAGRPVVPPTRRVGPVDAEELVRAPAAGPAPAAATPAAVPEPAPPSAPEPTGEPRPRRPSQFGL